MPDESLRNAAEEKQRNFLTRIKLPLWVTLAAIAAVMIVAIFIATGGSNVDLGKGIKGAETVDVQVQLCNQVVDANKVDVRRAELDFEKGLRDLGAKAATVRIDRPEPCPSTTTAPAGSTTTTTTRR